MHITYALLPLRKRWCQLKALPETATYLKATRCPAEAAGYTMMIGAGLLFYLKAVAAPQEVKLATKTRWILRQLGDELSQGLAAGNYINVSRARLAAHRNIY